MNILIVLMRLLHIVFAFIWFGVGVADTLFVVPASMRAGESGMRFFKAMYVSFYSKIFAVAGGVTTLMGLLLYIFGNAPSHFSTTGNIVLGIGALAGLAATIHGGAVTGRSSRAFAQALEQLPNSPAPAETVANLQSLAAAMLSHSRLSMILMVIALLGMGSARYL